MNFFKYLRGVLFNMPKIQSARSRKKIKVSKSILGKRKLSYEYPGFLSSTSRPPLASPKLEENSGVKRNVKVRN